MRNSKEQSYSSGSTCHLQVHEKLHVCARVCVLGAGGEAEVVSSGCLLHHLSFPLQPGPQLQDRLKTLDGDVDKPHQAPVHPFQGHIPGLVGADNQAGFPPGMPPNPYNPK